MPKRYSSADLLLLNAIHFRNRFLVIVQPIKDISEDFYIKAFKGDGFVMATITAINVDITCSSTTPRNPIKGVGEISVILVNYYDRS